MEGWGIGRSGGGGDGRREAVAAVVAMSGGALAVRERARQVGVAGGTLLEAGVDTTAGRREVEGALVAALAWPAAVGQELGEGGAAFEAMLFWE